METLTRLVSESLARHGFERPVDYRRLQWSRWFRCESHHSLLTVPSKPGVFAIAEEIMDLGSSPKHVETTVSAIQSAASDPGTTVETSDARTTAGTSDDRTTVEERRFSAASGSTQNGALAPVVARRMLAVAKFFEDDDMAFVLDRMISQQNPMRALLTSGRYFVRYVVIEDASQRRSICNALNQWIASSAEKATGIGSHFASSLEYVQGAESTREGTAPSIRPASLSEATASATNNLNSTQSDVRRINSAPTLNSAVATNIHCSSSFPSGF